MIFTLTDREYNVLDAYETENYLIGKYIGSIIQTLDIEVFTNSLGAENWVEGNYIMCEDRTGYKYWFTIYDAEDTHGGDTKILKCYSGTIDIVGEDANPIERPSEPKPFEWYFDKVFHDTGITIGINEISDLTRTLEFSSENASNAEMLQYVLNGFGAEADLAVEFTGSSPTSVVLNVFRQIGNEKPQTLLSDEDTSLTYLQRTGSIGDLATALNPFGKTETNEEGEEETVTLAGKYYEELDENGEILYYSPVNHTRIYSVRGRYEFYVQLPGKGTGEFDGYINRRYQSEAATQDALWTQALNQLKKIDRPNVTYDAKGHIDCNIGDTIQIISHEMKPSIMISARVLEYKFNEDDPTRNEYVFGNYETLESNIDNLSELINEVKKSVIYIKNQAVDYQLHTNGHTAPEGEWSTDIPNIPQGQWLWTRTTTFLSNGDATYSYSVSRNGADGSDGADGTDGEQGPQGVAGPKGDKGDTGPKGDKGDPTGIVEQASVPTAAQRYVGMLWRNTGAAGYINGAVYRWSGSAWGLFLFHADNISATNLAAITANLGTVHAGMINGKQGVWDLGTGRFETYSTNGNQIILENGVFTSYNNEAALLETIRLYGGTATFSSGNNKTGLAPASVFFEAGAGSSMIWYDGISLHFIVDGNEPLELTKNLMFSTVPVVFNNNTGIRNKSPNGVARKDFYRGTDDWIYINGDGHGRVVLKGTVESYGNIETKGDIYLPNNKSIRSHTTYGTDTRLLLRGTDDWVHINPDGHGRTQLYGTTQIMSLQVSGTKNAVHVTRDGVRATPAYETAESYLGDIGEATTSKEKEIKIEIEELFNDTVNTEIPYQVFLQSYGEGHVWISERKPTYFVVKSTIEETPFAWEIKAKRRGYENDRLVSDKDYTNERIKSDQGLSGKYAEITEDI